MLQVQICDFVRYLNPSKVHANVIPRSGETKESVENRLRKLCSLPHRTVHENAGKVSIGVVFSRCRTISKRSLQCTTICLTVTHAPKTEAKRCVRHSMPGV